MSLEIGTHLPEGASFGKTGIHGDNTVLSGMGLDYGYRPNSE